MHVGLLTTSFPMPGNPASGIFVARLAEHLSREISLTVLTPDGVDAAPPAPDSGYAVRCFRYAPRRWQRIAHQPGGIPVALKNHRWLWLLPAFLLAMFFACWRLSREVNLIHANWTAAGVVAGIAGRFTHTPVITTLRGSDVARLERSKLQRALLGLCVRTNARIICVSDSIAAKVAALAPGTSKKLTVVPNGVERSFLNIRRASFRSESEPLSLVMIGNLTVNKAPRVAVDALRRIAGQSGAELTIVGEGPERSALARMVDASGLERRVRLVGQQSPQRIPDALARAHALVLTSRSEGRPNVVLEAMAAELPVIATRIPGVTEIVQHEISGLLFERDDVTALAECILRLERDPEFAARLGSAGRRFILEHGLLWEQTARSYLEIYRATCGAARS